MARIKTLSIEHAQKIAAGQVVDRPASIVKELIENAVDAGATHITISVEGGGHQSIRVEDNGCGMDEADAQKCFEKHATSKISSFEEVPTINTFGFRGEALASIAAVSHVALITREPHSSVGTLVEIENGNVLRVGPMAAAPGTDITISKLFDAIPARKKFLKKKETEWRHILSLFHAFCLDELTIHFILYADGKQVLNCPATTCPIERFAQLKDSQMAQHMLLIEGNREKPSIAVSGIISDYATYRYDRDGIFFFVNKRWVQNFSLSKALINGYKNTLPQGKFPCAALHITIDPIQVDINVHPRKEEVQFLQPYVVQEVIEKAVASALEQKLSVHLQATSSPSLRPSSTPAESTFVPFNFEEWFTRPANPSSSSSLPFSLPPVAISAPSFAASSSKEPAPTPLFSTPLSIPDFTLVGQFLNTYIIVEQTDGLLLIDQHAAHERILYEEFEQNFLHIPTITLLFPQAIHLTREDMDVIEPHLTLFNQYGLGIEQAGENLLSISATPVHLKNVALAELISELIAKIKEHNHIPAAELHKRLHNDVRAQMACKAAVKAGDILTADHMKELIKDLYKTSHRFACPHGRPTSWFIPLGDIEKKFRRDYKS